MIRRTARPPREGIILVVVVSLLALFAVIGLGYVLFAESAATASRISKEAQNSFADLAQIDPEQVLNHALGALIYDKPDDITGAYCALRGHGLARNMYGSGVTLTDVAPATVIQGLYGSKTVQVGAIPPNVVPFVQNGQVA